MIPPGAAFSKCLEWPNLVPQFNTRQECFFLVPHPTNGWNDPTRCHNQRVSGMILLCAIIQHVAAMILLRAISNTRLEWSYQVSQSTHAWNDLILCHNSTRGCNDPIWCHIQHVAGMILRGATTKACLEWSYLVLYSTRGWNDPTQICTSMLSMQTDSTGYNQVYVFNIIFRKQTRSLKLWNKSFECCGQRSGMHWSQLWKKWMMTSCCQWPVRSNVGKVIDDVTLSVTSEVRGGQSEWWRHVVSEQ